MRAVIKTSLFYSLILSSLTTCYLFFFATDITHFFIDDLQTIRLGQLFLKAMCVTCPCVSITMIIITIFQAAGHKLIPMILAILRKGGLDIPLMFIFNYFYGLMGVVWAMPIADALAMTISMVVLQPFLRKHVEKHG